MRRAAALLVGAAIGLAPARAPAQQGCGADIRPAQAWPPPLDRRIALRARDVSLREALDRVAAAARFRVSYSAEFLPLDRHVCVSVDSIAAGDALAELLTGVDVSTVVASADQVVIAPSRPAPAPRESVQTLDRVVVTGSAIGNAQRPLSVAVDVLDRRQIMNSSGTLASSFDGNIAGLWLWEQSPSTLLARYGSIRGASSFGLSYPKVYIDGIEVANPLLLTDLNPATVDRVEVIRGPQGAALYGADAISGVVNIITRHEGLQVGESRTAFESRVGLSQTAFADNSALTQNHSLSWRAGSNVRSGSLGMNVSTLGGYVPDAYSRDIKLNGGFRVVSSTASVTGTGRVYAKRAAAGHNPLIMGFLPAEPGAAAWRDRSADEGSDDDSLRRLSPLDSLPQTVKQYTFGATYTSLTGTRWVPSFSAGVDGYRLSHVANDLGVVPSALDSALNSAEGGADRVTFRYALVGQFDPAPRQSLTLTLSAEHSRLQETLVSTAPTSSGGSRSDTSSYRSNTGLVAQANYAMNDAVYVTGGARLERNNAFAADQQTVLLPMIGLAGVRELGFMTVKGRAAYGVGVRPARSAAELRRVRVGTTLDPERQSGFELGADLFVNRRFALHLTRFDQRASGLIQQVPLPRDLQLGSSGPGPGPGRIEYVLQNVGEIRNRGWELESSYDLGYLSLSGAFTSVDSRVQRTARSYSGDLRVGDRMLAVPAGTASLSASWSVFGWRAGVSASRAFDWINYDRLRIAQDYANCDSCFAETVSGAKLHSYWMRYAGATRMRASLSRELSRGVGLHLTADNLTNVQRGEPDNITVLPGRTLLLGVSAKIR
jgi:iron complex outermembrane receptor protein